MVMTKDQKWEGFLKEVSNLLFFWFFAIVFFTIHRITFILLYRHEIEAKTEFGDFANALFTGFRFDCTVVSYFLLIPLVFTFILSLFGQFGAIKKIRVTFQYIFVILSSLLCVVTLNYYKVYSDQFNNFLFLSLTDDVWAIAKTIVEYYYPILNLFFLILAIVVSLFIFRYFEKKEFIYAQLKRIKPSNLNVVLVSAVFVLLYISCFRGTFGRIATTRRWAATTTSPFLNKTIMNPLRSLKYAYSDYKKISSIEGNNPFGEIDLVEFYGKNLVSEVIVKKAKGDTIEKPKHIFVVIMESYDSWPLMDKYSDFKVAESLKGLAAKGTFFTDFLPAYNATGYAYQTIVTGIPNFGIAISPLSQPNTPYVSSIFAQFKKLGYQTNMFYGGYASWEDIGNFTSYQGCDNVYTGADIEDDKMSVGDWGVKDESLFNKVMQTIDPDEYTFNVILTVSNHPPYSVDIYERGFPYKMPEDLPEEARSYFKNGMPLLELGHVWYGDWAIGQFMEQAEVKFEKGLYAFTGDHYGRKFINATPDLYERSSVPFVIYGNGVPQQKLRTPGGHADVLPTLIEMVAPEGFEYYSFGNSMLDADKHLGIGCGKVIDSLSVYEYDGVKVRSMNLNTLKEGESEIDSFEWNEEYNNFMRLAWHYVARGDSLCLKKRQ